MSKWKPDHQFLDFLLTNYAGGDAVSEEMVENMRAGETPLSRSMYKITFDTFKEGFEVYKATTQQTWSSN